MANDLSKLFTEQMAALQEELERADSEKQKLFRRVISLQTDIIRGVIDAFVDLELTPSQIAVLSDRWLTSEAWIEIDTLRGKLGLDNLRDSVTVAEVDEEGQVEEAVTAPIPTDLEDAGDEPVL